MSPRAVKAGHLGRFATQQDAAIFATPIRDSFDDRGHNFRRQLARGDVVEKEERPRALDQNVIDTVVHQITSDSVMDAGGKSDLKLGADAVGRRDQHRLAQLGERAVKHAAKTANLRQRACVKSRARELFNFFGGAVGGVYVDAGRRVGCRFGFHVE